MANRKSTRSKPSSRPSRRPRVGTMKHLSSLFRAMADLGIKVDKIRIVEDRAKFFLLVEYG